MKYVIYNPYILLKSYESSNTLKSQLSSMQLEPFIIKTLIHQLFGKTFLKILVIMHAINFNDVRRNDLIFGSYNIKIQLQLNKEAWSGNLLAWQLTVQPGYGAVFPMSSPFGLHMMERVLLSLLENFTGKLQPSAQFEPE